MIAVELTQKNWEIYDLLCELDAEYQTCDDAGVRADIIAKANELCNGLEL